MAIKKINIPKRVRSMVWEKYIGKKWKGSCNVNWCNNKFNVLSSSWHVGHDIPESKGGSLNISNLRPICSDCNIGMGNNYSIQEWSSTFKDAEEKKNIKKLEKSAIKILLKL